MLRFGSWRKFVSRVKDADVLLIAPPYKGMLRESIGLFHLASLIINRLHCDWRRRNNLPRIMSENTA